MGAPVSDDLQPLADTMRALSPDMACELAAGLIASHGTARAPRACLRTAVTLLRVTADRVEAMIPHAPEGT